jgi:hypothetical protein
VLAKRLNERHAVEARGTQRSKKQEHHTAQRA